MSFKVSILNDDELIKTRGGFSGEKFSKMVLDPIRRLLKEFGTEVSGGPPADVLIGVYRESYNGTGVKSYTLENEAVVLTIQNLYWDSGKAFEEVKEIGESEGRNVLFQLNSGKISMEDFNKNR